MNRFPIEFAAFSQLDNCGNHENEFLRFNISCETICKQSFNAHVYVPTIYCVKIEIYI